MQINMTSEQAINLIASRYRGLSDPLTHHRNVRHNTQNIREWLSSPKDEAIDQDRKYHSVPFFLEISQPPYGTLDGLGFPADFDFSDGNTMHPDKGIVKALYNHGLLRDRRFDGELIFELSPAMQAQFAARRR